MTIEDDILSITMVSNFKWEKIFKHFKEKTKHYYRTYESAYYGKSTDKIGENGRIA